MRLFLDTEFTDFVACELISIGVVSEDGREFYGELSDFDRTNCSDFVQAIVLPKLQKTPAVIGTRAMVGLALQRWLDTFEEELEICSDFDGDWHHFASLLNVSNSCELPMRMSYKNINQNVSELDVERYWMLHECNDHHALHDARAIKYAYEQYCYRGGTTV